MLALLFIIPPATMLQNDSTVDQEFPAADGSVLTNEQGVETTPESEESETQTGLPEEDDVNVEGDRSSKKFLDAFKLNFDPFDPEDGEIIDCTATVHNFGTERQIAYNVNVEFWNGEDYIGTDTIPEIQPGENDLIGSINNAICFFKWFFIKYFSIFYVDISLFNKNSFFFGNYQISTLNCYIHILFS